MTGILGTKLRREREGMGITQEELAKAVGLSSEFISQLEKGKRRPSLETLTALSSYLKKDASYFLTEKETVFNILLRVESLDKKAISELRKFKRYCEEYLRLEEMTGCRLELAPNYSRVSPERMASEERRRLGLGYEPIRDIFLLLELNGLRILRHPIPESSKISGVFIFLETEEAAFALVNSLQDPSQQVFVAAHAYCHYLKERFGGPVIDSPDFFVDEYLPLYHPREKLAQRFASQFLMPSEKVREIIEKSISATKLFYEDVLYIRRYFGASVVALLYKLKELGYLTPPKFKEYQKLDALRREESIFKDLPMSERQKKARGKSIVSDRFRWLAFEAYKKKKISEEKLAKLLSQDINKLLSKLANK